MRSLFVAVVVCMVVFVCQPARAQNAVVPPSSNVSAPKWQGGVFLDAAVRDWLRAPTASGRKTADDVSTVLLWSMAAAPYATSVANVLARGGTWRDAAGLALVDSEALGLAAAAAFLMKNVGRERPYATAAGLARYCANRPEDPQCGSDRNASFFSGHTAIAFTGAGLVCIEQLTFGPRGADALACGTAFAVAATTAALRMVADMHYATDTLAGAGLGLVAGMLVPYVLHFAPWAPLPVGRSLHADGDVKKHPSLVNLQVSPWGAPSGGGLAIGARF